jgi:hypothetical protein
MKKIKAPIKLIPKLTELSKTLMTKIIGGNGHKGGDKRKKTTGC